MGSVPTVSGHIRGTLMGKTEKRTEIIFQEILAENFSNMGKELDTEVQEAQRIPSKMNSKR